MEECRAYGLYLSCQTPFRILHPVGSILAALLCIIHVPIHQHIFKGCGHRYKCVSINIYIKIMHWALWRRERSVPLCVIYVSIRSVKKTCETGS